MGAGLTEKTTDSVRGMPDRVAIPIRHVAYTPFLRSDRQIDGFQFYGRMSEVEFSLEQFSDRFRDRIPTFVQPVVLLPGELDADVALDGDWLRYLLTVARIILCPMCPDRFAVAFWRDDLEFHRLAKRFVRHQGDFVEGVPRDRKSTRLNSSHLGISY